MMLLWTEWLDKWAAIAIQEDPSLRDRMLMERPPIICRATGCVKSDLNSIGAQDRYWVKGK
jgi:hypothetical protein